MGTTPLNPEPQLPDTHYLSASYRAGLRSWFLTTDHKRIALLYLASVTVFFFIGGIFATMIRIHLLTPGGALVTPETYNKLFIMNGAKDLAFPKINLLSWYMYVVGGCFVLYSFSTGGLDTGWTFYTPLSSI